ncbi:MAG: hypothetical protein J0H68_06495 [Sphingobacteriia bacterium]|nr:hypothetical protein [Sphingobacteriia bacterium]
MSNKNNKYSLSTDYFHFVFIISSILVIIYAWVSWLNYNKLESNYNSKLSAEFNIIDKEITQSFDYINYITIFIQNQIRYFYNDIKEIEKLFLSLDYDYKSLNLPSITSFSWVNLNKKIIISSKNGYHQKPVDISYRRSLNLASRNPGQIFFDQQTIGTISGIHIVPAVKAITNFHNKIIGFISVGLSVDGLTTYLENSINLNEISYILFYEDGSIITQSSKHKIKIPKNFFIEKFKTSTLPNQLVFNDIHYNLIKKASRHPFIIAVGYYPKVVWDDVKETLKLQVIPFIIMGFLFAIILYEFKHRIFKPIFELSKLADEIANGNIHVKITEFPTYEIDNFAKHLGRIQSYINEIIKIDTELRKAKLIAENASKTKSAFLANMSHELRTPLFTVTGYAEAIKEQIYGPLKNEYINAANNIYLAGLHLLELINDILDLSKAESGSMELNESIVDLNLIFVKCIEFVKKMAEEKNIDIKFIKNDELKFAYIDELRFKQIILNILSNSLKFTGENGHIIIEILKTSSHILIKISDNGIGVDPKDIPLILSEFGQARNAFVRNIKQGTGLGLPLAIKFIKLHNGYLEFKSELNKGSTVEIYIPLDRLRNNL